MYTREALGLWETTAKQCEWFTLVHNIRKGEKCGVVFADDNAIRSSLVALAVSFIGIFFCVREESKTAQKPPTD